MLHFFSVTIPIILLAATSIIQTWWIARLSDHIREIEGALFLRQWIDAVNSGESVSDMAYMREKGFLK